MLVADKTGGKQGAIFTTQVLGENKLSLIKTADDTRRKRFMSDGSSRLTSGTVPYWANCTSPHGRAKRTIEPLVDKIYGGEILEIGCSTGLSTREIATLFPDSKITAIDNREDAIEVAMRQNLSLVKNRGVEFVLADGYFLAEWFGNRLFGTIMAMNNILFNLDSFPENDLACVMHNLVRGLKTGGSLLFSKEEFSVLFRKEERRLMLLSTTAKLSSDYKSINRLMEVANKPAIRP